MRLSRRPRRVVGLAVLVVALSGCAAPPRAMHGVSVGDVASDAAVLWSRSDRAARMRVEVWPERAPDGSHTRHYEAPVTALRDFTGRVSLRDLEPDTAYAYRVRFEAGPRPFARAGPAREGRFRSAPDPTQARALRIAFSGDLAGQNVCRDAELGFPIFRELSRARPDIFIGLGDMIYGDGVCEARGLYGNAQIPGDFGPATDIQGYWAHWRYTRADAHLQALLASTAYLPIWDDHEVVNDAGPHQDTRDAAPYRAGDHLLPAGLQAFLDYNPVEESALRPATPGVGGPLPSLHRSARWGRHLEIFVLDTRRQRDPNRAPDRDDAPKTLLGAAQRAWLEQGLAESDATWKLVVSSVPIAVPTGSAAARDGWSGLGGDTGFQRELGGVLRSLHRAGVHNSLWITTDIHFATVFRYAPFPDSALRIHEIASGPLSAGLFPKRAFDPAFGAEPLFFYGPERPEDLRDYADAVRWFNFGILDVAEDGSLELQVVNGRGESVYRERLAPR